MFLPELKNLYINAKKAYNDGEPLMSDEEFDALENRIRLEYPKDCEFTYETDTVAPEESDKLPIPMPSLKKIKTEHEMNLWLGKGYLAEEYVVTAKLDGISAEWIPSKNLLMTRYDGINGRDISVHIENIRGLVYPGAKEKDYRNYISSRASVIGKDPDLITDFSSLDNLIKNVREKWQDGETIEYLCDMSREREEMAQFNLIIRGEIMLRKDSKIINGPFRNVCAGIVNRKEETDDAKELEFVAYEICNPPHMKPSDQIELLKYYEFKVCRNVVVTKLTADDLSEIFDSFEKEDPFYGYDGVVIYPNVSRPEDFKHEIRNSKVVLPEDRRAWKVRKNQKVYSTKVLKVEWNTKSDGKMVPVIIYETITIDGVECNRVSGHNAKIIKDNGIGPGSEVIIVRANDTIPKLEGVISQMEPQFPSECDWEWRGQTDIYQVSVSKEQLLSRIEKSLGALETDKVGPSIIEKLFHSGFDDVFKIYSASEKDFLILPGVRDATANNIYNGLRKNQEKWTIVTLMVASLCFPPLVGESKLSAMLENNPDWKNWNTNCNVYGISSDTVAKICASVPSFEEWLNKFPIKIADRSKKITTKEIIVFTGVRSSDLERDFRNLGHTIAENVTKKTTLLIFKNSDKKTSSHLKAEGYGIKCLEISSVDISKF